MLRESIGSQTPVSEPGFYVSVSQNYSHHLGAFLFCKIHQGTGVGRERWNAVSKSHHHDKGATSPQNRF